MSEDRTGCLARGCRGECSVRNPFCAEHTKMLPTELYEALWKHGNKAFRGRKPKITSWTEAMDRSVAVNLATNNAIEVLDRLDAES